MHEQPPNLSIMPVTLTKHQLQAGQQNSTQYPTYTGHENETTKPKTATIFADEPDDGKQLESKALLPPWEIMIVDDESEVHDVTKLALQRMTYDGRPLVFHSAYSAREAGQVMIDYPGIAVVILDVVMETNQAGLTFVRYLRNVIKNKRTRIILCTGHPGEAPEEAIIREYDINDYKTKTELTRKKLYTSIMISLRTYEQLLAFEANQEELELLYEHMSERNRELQRAKDLAEAASSAKDEFLSLMNHELRTPLNVILMRSEILDNGIYGQLSAKQKNSLELIRNSSHHLLAIIDDILDLAGIENGKLTVTKRTLCAQDICEQGIQIVQGMATHKEVELRYHTEAAEAIYIYADERRVLQVIEKLLRNAIKFSEKGATVGLEVTQDDAAQVASFAVWDEGIGIAPADISRLFQPFVQLEHSLTRRYEGAGLGLTIASRFVHLMDGKISVSSTPGMGSKFIVTLPLSDSNAKHL